MSAPLATPRAPAHVRIPATLVVAGLLAAGAAALSGCVPVVVAGAAGGAALVASDRRTAGAQVEDESIELKITDQIMKLYGDKVHVNVTSFNGVVLLTGEVPDQGNAVSIGGIAKNTPKVTGVHNEIVVAPLSVLGQRTNDTYITSKVKARFIEANRFPPTAVKVVTERGVVYLMGIVTRAEGESAGEIAATTEGVHRVVKIFEYR
ncbi:MAG: BON domain-containing protein [Burkholderiales bacterium]|nr:BON domain-containing protein [Burkholderiales bacterium]